MTKRRWSLDSPDQADFRKEQVRIKGMKPAPLSFPDDIHMMDTDAGESSKFRNATIAYTQESGSSYWASELSR